MYSSKVGATKSTLSGSSFLRGVKLGRDWGTPGICYDDASCRANNSSKGGDVGGSCPNCEACVNDCFRDACDDGGDCLDHQHGPMADGTCS